MKTTIHRHLTTSILTACMIGGLFLLMAPAAHAQTATVAQLQAQIQQLLTQIAALQASLGSASSQSYPAFTRDLAVGSRGNDVSALQQFLISRGHAIPAGATGYFGPQTQSALAAYQRTVGIAPATGYFGVITRSQVNAVSAPVIGGAPITTTPVPGSGTKPENLSGGAGTIENYTIVPGINNEKVGEGEADVNVAGITIKASDTSDIKLTAVRIDFDPGTATREFRRYADEVSVWLDGKEIARSKAQNFNRDNNYARTLNVTQEAIIRAGKTGKLVVSVSGLKTIDSADIGKTWQTNVTAVRYMDAQGASISENTALSARTFSFERFANAQNVELRIALHNDTPDAQVVNVDSRRDTDNVELLRFTMRARGSNIKIEDLPITLSVTGASDVDAIANTLYAVIGNKRYSESVSTSAANATVVFNNINYTVEKGDTVTVSIRADINDLEPGIFSEGDTLTASLTASNRNAIVAEDQTKEDLDPSDMTGTALGNTFAFYDTGIDVRLISATETLTANDGANNDSGTFRIRYRVTAFDGTVYVSDTPAATTAYQITDTTLSQNGTLYIVDKGGSAITDNVSAVITYSHAGGATDSTNGVRIDEGRFAEFNLTVVRTNTGTAGDSGFYRLLLKTIGWNTNDSDTWNVYSFNLNDFRTSPVFLN